MLFHLEMKEGFNWIESDKEIFNEREYKKWTAHEG